MRNRQKLPADSSDAFPDGVAAAWALLAVNRACAGGCHAWRHCAPRLGQALGEIQLQVPTIQDERTTWMDPDFICSLHEEILQDVGEVLLLQQVV